MNLNKHELELFEIVEKCDGEIGSIAKKIILQALDKFDNLSENDILLFKGFKETLHYIQKINEG